MWPPSYFAEKKHELLYHFYGQQQQAWTWYALTPAFIQDYVGSPTMGEISYYSATTCYGFDSDRIQFWTAKLFQPLNSWKNDWTANRLYKVASFEQKY